MTTLPTNWRSRPWNADTAISLPASWLGTKRDLPKPSKTRTCHGRICKSVEPSKKRFVGVLGSRLHCIRDSWVLILSLIDRLRRACCTFVIIANFDFFRFCSVLGISVVRLFPTEWVVSMVRKRPLQKVCICVAYLQSRTTIIVVSPCTILHFQFAWDGSWKIISLCLFSFFCFYGFPLRLIIVTIDWFRETRMESKYGSVRCWWNRLLGSNHAGLPRARYVISLRRRTRRLDFKFKRGH